ncbi:hypothetical protein Rhopal_000732-T1 [Rhodotorula paludigena]|uniref:Vacuolar protein 14 C-terminal Fig4-binding domain-containing protein n=1 Tax=Rhodotorula paludigena TaxID=86838 RepID=A0AAV5GEK7_9BASI|nr:hypothetical protein Rhopal_000732-T1 [Rhodotorula paludigena]
MEPAVKQGLQHQSYETRKKTALQYEVVLREIAASGTPENEHKLRQIITQLVELAGTKVHAARSGGIMGLASTAIALGPRLPEYLGALIMPVLACFEDHDSKLRYYACESMYNIAKVANGEILVYFNELFDSLSKLAADTEVSVKNGSELLDRLLKDIVTEQAAIYISRANFGDDYDEDRDAYAAAHPSTGAEKATTSTPAQPQRAFSLPRFIPLLHERISVLNPFTRTFLISWLLVLDSVPELELISHLPDFLEGLLKYLGDPTAEVRFSTESLLEGLLKETREVRQIQLEGLQARREAWEREMDRRRRRASEARTVTVTDTDGVAADEDEAGRKDTPTPRTGTVSLGGGGEEDEHGEFNDEAAIADSDEEAYPLDGDGSEEWIPGQGVHIDYAAIVDILVQHLSFPDEEIQATCLHWISEFLQFVPGVVVPFAPRLIPVILSALAHHVPAIQQAATDTNDILFSVVQSLPIDSPAPYGAALSPSTDRSPPQPSTVTFSHDRHLTASPPPSSIPFPTSSTAPPRPGHDRQKPGSDASAALLHHHPSSATLASTADSHLTVVSPLAPSPSGGSGALAFPPDLQDEYEPDGARFQYGLTVNELTLQFLSDNEETRVASLEWLLMLHQKAPRKILAGDDPSFTSRRDRPSGSSGTGGPSTSRQRNASASSTSSGLSLAILLKLLSDSSERVLRYDLQLLAQISSLGTGSGTGATASSEAQDDYFVPLMTSLLELFSTDRKLLETRGSLIIRQLCGSLNAERIYRTCAEILEKDEDLEFASIMVQNLNLIMITAPELSDFRKRLRTLDSKDGQNLFVTLYRSWSHNAVATFTLCLLAQAYEQASALLQIFADLEMTVPMLIQIDKLVQLIESPVFTSLRLQLLEPERYPYLLKAMYGLLMLLPQSSAFATLRNRLSAVSSLGFLQTVPRSSLLSPSALRSSAPHPSGPAGGASSVTSARATPDPPSIRWTELLAHFRGVQKRRRTAAARGAGAGQQDAAGAGGAATGRFPGEGVGEGISPSTSMTATSGFGAPAGSSRFVGTAGGGARRRNTPLAGPGQGFGGGGGGAGGRAHSAAADAASLASSQQTGGSGRVGRGGAVVGGAASALAAQRALSPTMQGGAAKRRFGSGPAGAGISRRS